MFKEAAFRFSIGDIVVMIGVDDPGAEGKAFKRGITNKTEDIVLFRAEVIRTYASNARPEASHPDSIIKRNIYHDTRGNHIGDDRGGGGIRRHIKGMTPHTHLDIRTGHLPVDVSLTSEEGVTILDIECAAAFRVAPAGIAGLHLEVARKIVAGGECHPHTQTLSREILISSFKLLRAGLELEKIFAVHFNFNGGSRSISGHCKCSCQSESGNFFHESSHFFCRKQQR